jgi:diguanylate cyclase (GGDEF)-like protein
LQASTDALTGLPNRRAMEERINALTRGRRPFTLALIDLDHFKMLNDSFGHEMGDRWLRQFAEILTKTVRSADLVARWGGEEFMLIFPETAVYEAAAVCDRIRSEMLIVSAAGNLPRVTASFGLVDSCDGNVLEDLFAIADGALYVAKHTGRDRVVVGPALEADVP